MRLCACRRIVRVRLENQVEESLRLISGIDWALGEPADLSPKGIPHWVLDMQGKLGDHHG